MRYLIIVGCGASKRPNRSRAVDLYTGPLFKSHLDLLASAGLAPTHVLSALHGLISAGTMIDPYERRLPTTKAGRAVWGELVLSHGAEHTGADVTWVVLAGGPYADPWRAQAEALGTRVLEPLRGLTQGTRRAVAKCCRGDKAAALAALGLVGQC